MPQQVERKIWAHHAVTIVRIETVSPPALAACCLWRESGCLPLSNTMIPSRSSQNQSPCWLYCWMSHHSNSWVDRKGQLLLAPYKRSVPSESQTLPFQSKTQTKASASGSVLPSLHSETQTWSPFLWAELTWYKTTVEFSELCPFINYLIRGENKDSYCRHAGGCNLLYQQYRSKYLQRVLLSSLLQHQNQGIRGPIYCRRVCGFLLWVKYPKHQRMSTIMCTIIW